MKPTPPTFHERERDAILEHAVKVATDPASSPEDVASARSRIGQPDLGQMLESVSVYKLVLLRAVLDEHDPLHARMRALVQRPE